MTDFAAALANDLSTAREAATRCNESIRQWELRIGFAEKRKVCLLSDCPPSNHHDANEHAMFQWSTRRRHDRCACACAVTPALAGVFTLHQNGPRGLVPAVVPPRPSMICQS